MQLESLLAGVALRAPLAEQARGLRVSGLCFDSRKAGEGKVFVAFVGAKADGRAFARQAMERGCVAVVSELEAPADFEGLWIVVEHGRKALARMARTLYAAAAYAIRLCAVTGTNGKTTTSYLIDSILRAAGLTTAMVGTIEYHVGEAVKPAPNTTPESLEIYELLEELRQIGGTDAVMEVSSHALELGRVWGMAFHTAVFTNLTRDHLDFHVTMERYFAAKESLFLGQEGPAPRVAVLNADDAWAHKLRLAETTEVIWYSPSGQMAGERVLRAREVETGFDGLRMRVEWKGMQHPLRSQMVARINVANLLAAFGAGLAHGIAPEVIVRGLEACKAVPGRFERIDEGQPFLVAVDYAHTDDALRNTLRAARELNPGRIITVFGCGGDRDRAKRPLMGLAAGELSNYVVLTSDNPRSEDPLAIINDALVGLRRTDTPHVCEPDRERAIRRAIQEAGPRDLVVIAGKGHETYQQIQDRKLDFDDRVTARRILHAFGYRKEAHA
ncbi:MAG: UDP-N-acetylmuramoyl-L-alanyl-D-glutamate--2,6-diaminopimelate ligase [Bryobacterales bacterium]|nr:UDP-N-acetylmuramoyl-L-alanyl-D-glutamate--2,6-diaminopimelate ligase [Bryobacterales bacterium]